MPRGRPTLYRDHFCEMVVEFCKEGESLAAFAAEIGVSRECIQEWRRVHPDFSLACDRALTLCQRYWERELAKCARGEIIEKHHYGENGCFFQRHNPIVLMFTLRSRFKDYREPLMKNFDDDVQKDRFEMGYLRKHQQEND